MRGDYEGGHGLDMLEALEAVVPRTTTDVVFDHLHDEIVSLRLLPNSRISEAEIANKLGVSRQPVRDAFNRLGNLDLLIIRPQRPTLVRGFSLDKIQNARFIRSAIELEVAANASTIWDEKRAAVLQGNLTVQRAAIEAGDIEDFHGCDYDYHRIIFEQSGHPLAFETVQQCKQHVDRLCVLSLAKGKEADSVLADHEELADALKRRAQDDALRLVRRHLSRLDDTIKEIHETHSDYFE